MVTGALCDEYDCSHLDGCHSNGDCESGCDDDDEDCDVPNVCDCYDGYIGESCEDIHCNAVNDCSGHGECVAPNT